MKSSLKAVFLLTGVVIFSAFVFGGGSCLLPGTLVQMSNGSLTPIENVKRGDEIISFDSKLNLVVTKVLEIESPIRDDYYIIATENGKSVKITDEHPLYIKSGDYAGWGSIIPKASMEDSGIRTKKISVGDFLLNIEKKWVRIISIRHINERTQTYNLKKVDKTNTFFAEGFLVHNKGDSPTPLPPPACPVKSSGCYKTDNTKVGFNELAKADFGYFISEDNCQSSSGCDCKGVKTDVSRETEPDNSGGACSCIAGTEWNPAAKCCGDDADDAGKIQSGILCSVDTNLQNGHWLASEPNGGDIRYIGVLKVEYLSSGEDWLKCDGVFWRKLIGDREYMCIGKGKESIVECCGELGCKSVTDGKRLKTGESIDASYPTLLLKALEDFNNENGVKRFIKKIDSSFCQAKGTNALQNKQEGFTDNALKFQDENSDGSLGGGEIDGTASSSGGSSSGSSSSPGGSSSDSGADDSGGSSSSSSSSSSSGGDSTVTFSSTYTKNVGDKSTGCCDNGDVLISTQDTGVGNNHWVERVEPNCCRSVEGNGNKGNSGCLMTCGKLGGNCNIDMGKSCGYCGGTIQCDASCSRTDPDFGKDCNCNGCGCGGTIQCDGSCVGNPPPACSQGKLYCRTDGRFVKDLDTPNSQISDTVLNGKNKKTCEAAGFKWTGTKCCSEYDDPDEYYNDPKGIGGCWDSAPVISVDFVKNSGDSVVNYNGEFHGCAISDQNLLSLKDKHTAGQLIINHNYCFTDPKNNYYCKPQNSTNPSALSGKWVQTDGKDRSHYSLSPQSQDASVQSGGCCAEKECWDGTRCAENQRAKPLAPLTSGMRCIDGQWTQAFLKRTPDESQEGYCPEQSKCLLDPMGKNESSQCVDSGNYFEDNYCENGEWSTRTKLLALKMLKLKGGDYTLFCDNRENALNNLASLSSVNSNTNILAAIQTNKFCVLNAGGNVVVGASYNKDLKNITNIFGVQCNPGAVQNDSQYHSCDASKKLWINPGLKSFIYSPSSIIVPEEQNPTGSFQELILGPIRNVIEAIRRLISTPPVDESYLNALKKFDRIYMTQKGTRTIRASMEGYVFKNIVAEYGNLDNDLCAFVEQYARERNFVESGITCRSEGTGDNFANNNYYILVQGSKLNFNPESVWTDLTSKIRLK